MTCRRCHVQIPAGSKFCLECGEKVEKMLFCMNCGETLPAGAKFCSNCGAKTNN
nr:zinc ribbon domain-containing protein [Heyndrickxia ginsengihumi]